MTNTITRATFTGQVFIGEWFIMNHIPNPWFALAPNKVYSETSGNIIKLRRAGDNAESSFEFVNGELDKTAINNWIVAGGLPNNAYYTEWYNQLGNSPEKIIQATATDQPQYITNAINNRVGFQSVIPSPFLVELTGNVIPEKTSTATIFVVVNIIGDQGLSGGGFISTNETFTNNIFKITLATTTLRIQGKDNAGDNFITPTIAGATGIKLWTIVFDGVGNIKVYVNDDAVAGIDYDPAGGFLNNMRKIILGKFGGTMTECLIFDSVLSDGQKQTVKDYLNNKYAIY